MSIVGVTLFTCAHSDAADLMVAVRDQAGKPVAGMVVVAQSVHQSGKAEPTTTATAVMDQMNLQFVPYVLPVRTGTQVVFPNSDATAHQVYSFSPAKRFELGLYRGKQHAPVRFDKPGVVVVGCNIHDNMIGYVYVTDAPSFGVSDVNGEFRASALSGGDYNVQIWNPGLSDQERGLEKIVTVGNEQHASVTFTLTQPLRPAPTGKPRERRKRDY